MTSSCTAGVLEGYQVQDAESAQLIWRLDMHAGGVSILAVAAHSASETIYSHAKVGCRSTQLEPVCADDSLDQQCLRRPLLRPAVQTGFWL